MSGAIGVASLTISELFVVTVAEERLRIANGRIIDDPLVVADHKIGLSAAYAGKHLSSMDFVDEYFEVETLSGLGVG
jgi:hypothetical protein